MPSSPAPTPPATTPPRWRPVLVRVAAVVVSVGLVALVAQRVGISAVLEGLTAVTPVSAILALVLGVVGTAAQALRWWLLGRGYRIALGRRAALGDCYVSGFANMVLPGGVAGDALRVAVYRDRGARRWISPVAAIMAERLSATTVLCTATAGVMVWALVRAPSSSIPALAGLAAASGVVAGICAVITVRCLRPLPVIDRWRVWALAALSVAAWVTLFALAQTTAQVRINLPLALVGLAAMSLPLSVGGWGVREFAVTSLASLVAVTAVEAATAALAYGVLATISMTPGAAILVIRLVRARRRGNRHPTTAPAPQR